MTTDINAKVIAITGAGKGLGRAYAKYLGGLGARVIVNNRRHAGETTSSADRVVEEIVKEGGKAVAEHSSVEDPDAGNRLLATALGTYGRLDCLIANAGVSENAGFRHQTLSQLRQIVEINLMGTINVAHPVFRHMCDQRDGNIIVSTSSAGLFGGAGLPAYSASKAAVIGLMYSLSLEGASKNVRVNAIAPYAATQMTAEFLSSEIEKKLDPSHVAPVVAWLATGSVTGEILVSGGGRVARARTKTTPAEPLSEIDGFDWQMYDTANLDFADAAANFQEFVATPGTGR